MNKIRNSNIELLRIISIIMIVFSHYCVHGMGSSNISNLSVSVNRFILEIFTLGNFGSILFVLISGYYLFESQKVKLKKLLRLIFQILFYSVTIYLIFCLIGTKTFSIKTLIKSALPITFKDYWFATVYIVLYIFHPFINKMLNSLTRKEHLIFIYLMIFIFSILRALTSADYYGNELIQFVMFYSIGAYFGKYPDNYFKDKRKSYRLMFISLFLLIISVIGFDLVGTKIKIFNGYSINLLSRVSPFVILFCISLFNIFANKKVCESKFINYSSTLIFGVYLISDNKYIRPILWNNIFRCKEYITSENLIIHMIGAISLTIISCLLIEMIRKYLIENPIFKVLDKKIDLIQEKIEKILHLT